MVINMTIESSTKSNRIMESKYINQMPFLWHFLLCYHHISLQDCLQVISDEKTLSYPVYAKKSVCFWSVLLWVSQIYPKCILYLCLLFLCILEIRGLVLESLFCGCGELSWQSFIANLSLVGRLLILLREEICSPPFLSLSRVIDLLKGSLPTLILYHWRCSFFIGNWFHS